MRRCKLFNCDIKLLHEAYNPRAVKRRAAAAAVTGMTLDDNSNFRFFFPETLAPTLTGKIIIRSTSA